MQLDKKHNGEDVDAFKRSLGRWDVREIPYRMTGNKQQSQIVGIDHQMLRRTEWLFFNV